ncbi:MULTISPECIES: hypothetical protein [Methylobacterium]|uniref:Nitrate reductase n=1 Tax=Methylobacterium thuringiense TaxID=1003091 RepID=A0ABQ4TNQ1_9HYPH|nr:MULTISPECIES: hypothetical protein [Methylobacterium]TXN24166.1 hypothetical protein FV217_04225 [Methylobacterium sp. WL9]GJE56286.1 hypothetical protein EKPJFOCH_2787 [Methylobacterium thuringiense]
MALFGFGRPRPGDAERQAGRERVAAWAREAGGYGEGVVLKVNEIVCADPACPGFETVILVMAPGQRSVALKIVKPLADVTQDDVARAIRADG